MKYLIVSDIHGSLPCLEKVLDFYKQEQCNLLCILGDILNYGPRNGLPEGLDPKGIAERLNQFPDTIVAVRGNCVIAMLKSIKCYSIFPSCPIIH